MVDYDEQYSLCENRCAHGETDKDEWIVCKLCTDEYPVTCGYLTYGKIQEFCPKFQKRHSIVEPTEEDL